MVRRGSRPGAGGERVEPHQPGRADSLQEPGRPARRRCARGRRARRPACNSPRSSISAAGRSRWPSAATAACRAPYRGMDSYWWLDLLGALDRTIDDVGDPVAARHEPSLQLVGSPEGSTLDLATLQSIGVRLVGRLQAIDGGRATFASNVNAVVADTDRRMHRVLDRVDDAVERLSLSTELLAPDRPGRVAPVAAIESARSALGRHHLDRVGHRLPPPVRLGRAADPRPARRDHAVPRRHADARRIRARPALPALPQLELHRRRRPRRARRRRAHHRHTRPSRAARIRSSIHRRHT